MNLALEVSLYCPGRCWTSFNSSDHLAEQCLNPAIFNFFPALLFLKIDQMIEFYGSKQIVIPVELESINV